MGYGDNPEVVAARYHLLEDLDRGIPQRWLPEPRGTRKLAYQIREALHIASRHRALYPGLASAYDMFSIVVVRPGLIEARFKETPVTVTMERADVPAQETPIHGIGASFKTVPQVGISTAADCIASWEGHLPSSDPVLLQRTTLPLPELLKLRAYCDRATPRLMMLKGDDHITLSLYEAETAALANWQPPTVPAAPEEFDL